MPPPSVPPTLLGRHKVNGRAHLGDAPRRRRQDMLKIAATTQKTNRYLGALAALVIATTLTLAAVMAMGVSADNAEAATAVTKTFTNPTEIRIPGAAVVG